MKTKIQGAAHAVWGLFTETPGWPDAPRAQRVRRAVPLLLPFVGVLGLLVWNLAIRGPRLAAERAAHQPLIALENEIANLRLELSDRQAADTMTQAETLSQQVLHKGSQLPGALEVLKRVAVSHQWPGDFIAAESSTDAADNPNGMIFLTARAKLTAAAANEASFHNLLAVLKQFSTSEKRFDLTRLAIRADDQTGRYVAELNLRFPCPTSYEETP